MADPTPSYDDARRKAQIALDEPRMSSVKIMFKFFGGAVAVCSVVATGVSALHGFSLAWMIGLCVTAVATLPISYAVMELWRLGRQAAALKSVLEAEKLYESLLADARKERNEYRSQVTKVETQLELVRGVQVLINRQEAAERNNKTADQKTPAE